MRLISFLFRSCQFTETKNWASSWKTLLLTLIGKFPGYELDWFIKNSSNKNHWYLFSFLQISGTSWADSWKTHPIVNFEILEYNTGWFLENSSKIEHQVEKWNLTNPGAWHRPITGKSYNMDDFFRNRSSSCPRNSNFEKIHLESKFNKILCPIPCLFFSFIFFALRCFC